MGKILIFIILVFPFFYQCSKKKETLLPNCYTDSLINSFVDSTRNYLSVEKLSSEPQKVACTIEEISINDKKVDIPTNQNSHLGNFNEIVYDDFYNRIVRINISTDLLEIKYKIILKGSLTGIYLGGNLYTDSSFTKTVGPPFQLSTDFDLEGTANSIIEFKVRFLDHHLAGKGMTLIKDQMQYIGENSSSVNFEYMTLKIDMRRPQIYDVVHFPMLKIIKKRGGACFNIYRFEY